MLVILATAAEVEVIDCAARGAYSTDLFLSRLTPKPWVEIAH
jgi:hypothetical protein